MIIGDRDIAWSISSKMLFYTSATAHSRSVHEAAFFHKSFLPANMAYFVLVTFRI